MEELIRKADVLVESLPYIRRFYGKTIVIKYGGNAMTNAELKQDVTLDLVLMKYVGMNPVVVHGGGPKISEVMKKMGKKAEFVSGLRVTDAETIEIAEMVLVGNINKEIVRLINQNGGNAIGLSGTDGNLIIAKKHIERSLNSSGEEVSTDIGFVGDVTHIDPQLIEVVCRSGFIPVIAPIGVGEDGQTYNINADTVAGEISSALKAEKLILITDVKGILRNPQDENSLFSTVVMSEIDDLIKAGVITEGMLPKVEACVIALKGGVSKTHIIDGRISHSILLEIFTDKGIGTQIVRRVKY